MFSWLLRRAKSTRGVCGLVVLLMKSFLFVVRRWRLLGRPLLLLLRQQKPRSPPAPLAATLALG